MNLPGSSIEVYESKDDGATPQGTIAICTRDHLNAATATCMWTTDYSFLRPNHYVSRIVVQGSILTLQRNECLKRLQGDWILFIDDDMVWKPKDIGRLVTRWEYLQAQSDQPVIMGALCHRRTAPYDPTMYMREQPNAGQYRYLEKWDTDFVEVDATGLAFLLIPVKALEAISSVRWPSAEDRLTMGPPPMFTWEGGVGEDIRFCQKAKLAGCMIVVDTTIEIGHISEIAITRKHFLQEVANRLPEDEERASQLNQEMGIETLTAAEARKMLGWS